MALVRVARGFRLPIIAITTALALSGCMRTAAPVAAAPPSDLDSIAYGAPPLMLADSGSASLAAASRPSYTPISVAYAAARRPVVDHAAYRLDAGDKLRVVVYGQEGLSNTYAIDAGGSIPMPLIGLVPARGRTTAGLAAGIVAPLRNGYIRDPSVAVESEAYRPFFVLGEVAAPGLYPYVPNMTVESAVAIAGGFTPRAYRYDAEVSRSQSGVTARQKVPLIAPVRPGDTITVNERWF